MRPVSDKNRNCSWIVSEAKIEKKVKISPISCAPYHQLTKEVKIGSTQMQTKVKKVNEDVFKRDKKKKAGVAQVS